MVILLVGKGARGDLIDNKGMNVLASAAAFGQVRAPTLTLTLTLSHTLTPTAAFGQVGVINAIGEKLGVADSAMPQSALEQALGPTLMLTLTLIPSQTPRPTQTPTLTLTVSLT